VARAHDFQSRSATTCRTAPRTVRTRAPIDAVDGGREPSWCCSGVCLPCGLHDAEREAPRSDGCTPSQLVGHSLFRTLLCGTVVQLYCNLHACALDFGRAERQAHLARQSTRKAQSKLGARTTNNHKRKAGQFLILY
jgi:hypothetical protein